jgi:hypothetical protein
MPEAHYLPPIPQEAPASTIGALFGRKKAPKTCEAVDEAEALRVTGGHAPRPRVLPRADDEDDEDDEDDAPALIEGDTTLAGLSRMLGRTVAGAQSKPSNPAQLAAAALRKIQG